MGPREDGEGEGQLVLGKPALAVHRRPLPANALLIDDLVCGVGEEDASTQKDGA